MTTATADKTASKNGTSKTKPQAANQTPAKVQAPMATTTEMQRELTIAETIEKVNHLKQLLDRREALATKRSELRKFKFGKDESSAVLTLVDQDGNEFRTSNSNLIELMVTHLEKLISEKIDQFTDEILAFEF